MNINDLLTENLSDIETIIAELKENFNSYDFIRKFTGRFEVEYVRMLGLYDEEPFRKVNDQIASFLSNNEIRLNIVKQNSKTIYTNILGEKYDCEMWSKV